MRIGNDSVVVDVRTSPPGRRAVDRALLALVTGPIGRFVGTAMELVPAVAEGVRARIRRSRRGL